MSLHPKHNVKLNWRLKGLVDECLENTRQILKKHRDGIDRLAAALMEKETLFFRDIARILEPDRSELDIERESLILAEKKLVGKVPIINLEGIEGLSGPGKRTGKKSTTKKTPTKSTLSRGRISTEWISKAELTDFSMSVG